MTFQEQFVSALTTVMGFATVLGIFLLIQAFVRKKTGCGRGKDPLDYMPHGCAGCSGSKCRRKNHEEEHHHEIA